MINLPPIPPIPVYSNLFKSIQIYYNLFKSIPILSKSTIITYQELRDEITFAMLDYARSNDLSKVSVTATVIPEDSYAKEGNVAGIGKLEQFITTIQ